jgi:RNA polymerase sigma-70 factor, ECF subfamily
MRKDGEDMELMLDTPARLRPVPAPEPAERAGDDPHRESDTALLVRVADRDREAFEQLYARYVRPVFGLALRRLRDRQRAEDAVQETFAAV